MVTNIVTKMESTSRTGKRRQVSKDEFLLDLKSELPKIFKAFNIGIKKFNKVSSMFSPDSKVRFDASVLNTSIVESLQVEFSSDWKWGKYKRFILRLSDYIFLVKKLNNNNMPMNIKTKHVNTISNQLSLPMFDNEVYQDDPILFFGYKIDRMGEIVSPEVVYIDENQVKWIVAENDVIAIKTLFKPNTQNNTVKVSIKEQLVRRKASNE
ncbi:hypothetical protein [Tenacibaculum finnmarkense]|uniref:hypothetical protein n=1 Tax=Tenacibaculum finnmarkense TaxID=2781243 RepID=UPI001EFB9D38|nr:hypothetical protein [Tenacibaculum finnmarkense]MCG8206013.1 hypothetical protein [Tenacibaculum finnmarkense genomovar finnmarkense]MCG8721916.1 hypothetical protein [Tenacibaculum finnmarkense]MCG8740396.1 hypothetical protein [Tenacibaculum finnmarkense]MCG8763730.1 hypothetical protein [Tenacibaculum finnmarkense]MCG8778119.1 hypothetical protein [Tenacibaculum finnmarkense]